MFVLQPQQRQIHGNAKLCPAWSVPLPLGIAREGYLFSYFEAKTISVTHFNGFRFMYNDHTHSLSLDIHSVYQSGAVSHCLDDDHVFRSIILDVMRRLVEWVEHLAASKQFLSWVIFLNGMYTPHQDRIHRNPQYNKEWVQERVRRWHREGFWNIICAYVSSLDPTWHD